MSREVSVFLKVCGWSAAYQPPSMSREPSVWIVSREVCVIANYITLRMASRP